MSRPRWSPSKSCSLVRHAIDLGQNRSQLAYIKLMIEILPFIKGVEFDDAWQKRVEIVIDPVTGSTAFVLAREDLITAKLAAGRPQDLADVDAIRKAEEAQTKRPG